MNNDNLELGATYIHKEGGLRYKVEKLVLDATGYESGKEPRAFVFYTQLDAGSYPVGTEWVRERQDFLKQFEKAN